MFVCFAIERCRGGDFFFEGYSLHGGLWVFHVGDVFLGVSHSGLELAPL